MQAFSWAVPARATQTRKRLHETDPDFHDLSQDKKNWFGGVMVQHPVHCSLSTTTTLMGRAGVAVCRRKLNARPILGV